MTTDEYLAEAQAMPRFDYAVVSYRMLAANVRFGSKADLLKPARKDALGPCVPMIVICPLGQSAMYTFLRASVDGEEIGLEERLVTSRTPK
ncbi:hypothetical protein ACXU4B_10920 [Dyella soli]|uniref:Uncharacterized protein n=1 Tax=Dyella soli TaxID=522319 RepID=A0A4R0YGE5_9GAMM|nr:hypothetical protein [Dyella soli]TCI07316.1 hypothetical protein EZM97_32500 [Dyella soli]